MGSKCPPYSFKMPKETSERQTNFNRTHSSVYFSLRKIATARLCPNGQNRIRFSVFLKFYLLIKQWPVCLSVCLSVCKIFCYDACPSSTRRHFVCLILQSAQPRFPLGSLFPSRSSYHETTTPETRCFGLLGRVRFGCLRQQRRQQ